MKNPFRYAFRCFGLIVALLLVGCSKSKESFSTSELEHEFEGQFGFRPANKAFEIRCKIVGIGDTVTQWLSFQCDKDFIRQIAGTNFATIERGSIYKAGIPDIKMPNPNAPNWWKSMKDCDARDLYYIYSPHKIGADPLQNRFRYFWWDDSSGTIYYCNTVWR